MSPNLIYLFKSKPDNKTIKADIDKVSSTRYFSDLYTTYHLPADIDTLNIDYELF